MTTRDGGLVPCCSSISLGCGARGIGRFVADVLPDNHRMISVFRRRDSTSTCFSIQGLSGDAGARGSTEYIERVEEREWTAAVRSIEHILRPTTIASSRRAASQALRATTSSAISSPGSFTGDVYPVNRQADTVGGLRSYRSVTDVPGPIDLALLAVPAHRMGEVVRDCGAKGVRGLVVVTSGQADQEASGDGHRSRSGRARRTFGMRLVGPDCMGVINTCPQVRMNATSPSTHHRPVRRVLLPIRGARIASPRRARGPRLGISSFVSLGNKADVSGNDLLRFWEDDRRPM